MNTEATQLQAELQSELGEDYVTDSSDDREMEPPVITITPIEPQIRLSNWMAGRLVTAEKATGKFVLGLTVLGSFNDTPSAVADSVDRLEKMYSSDNPNGLFPLIQTEDADSSLEFQAYPVDKYIFLAPNPHIYSRMMTMKKARFIFVFEQFLYALHEERCDRQKSQSRIQFRRVNPPWFDGRVCLLLPRKNFGVRRIESIKTNGVQVTTVHSLDKSRFHPIAAAILTL